MMMLMLMLLLSLQQERESFSFESKTNDETGRREDSQLLLLRSLQPLAAAAVAEEVDVDVAFEA